MSTNTVTLTEAEADAIHEAVKGYLRQNNWANHQPEKERLQQALRKFRSADVLLLTTED
jgi:hypothetical protein